MTPREYAERLAAAAPPISRETAAAAARIFAQVAEENETTDTTQAGAA